MRFIKIILCFIEIIFAALLLVLELAVMLPYLFIRRGIASRSCKRFMVSSGIPRETADMLSRGFYRLPGLKELTGRRH